MCGRGHGPGVVQAVAQRLLAQHVLAGIEQAFDNLAVKGIRDDHADHVDVVGSGDGLPRRVVAFVAEPGGRGGADLGIHITDRDQADRWQHRVVQRRGGAVGRRVGFTGHSGTDDGDSNALGQRFSPS